MYIFFKLLDEFGVARKERILQYAPMIHLTYSYFAFCPKFPITLNPIRVILPIFPNTFLRQDF